MRWFIVSLVIIIYVFETVVAQLNQKHSRKPVPQLINDIYNHDRYQKWLAYSLEGHRFSLIQQGFGLTLLVVIFLGPLDIIEQQIVSWTSLPVVQSILFFGIFLTLITIGGIPFDIYKTFSIEERHGFNRTTKKIFVRDTLMNYLLIMVLGALLVGGLHGLYLKFFDNLWLFIFVTWAALSLLILLMVTFFSKLLTRLFNTFTPLPEGDLRNRITKLASNLGFNIKSILVMDASKRTTKSNAYFSGIGKSKEIVLYDTLLESMSDNEIIAVLAHELGHAIHRDIWRRLGQIIVQLALYIAGIGLILQSPSIFSAFGFSNINFGFTIILFSAIMKPIIILLDIPLNFLSRKAEYQADAFAAKHSDNRWLISALKVLARENLSNLNPHPLAVLLYYSHPPMNDRVKALQ